MATRPTLAGRLAKDMRSRILSGEIAPGARLNLDQMRESSGVSTSSMREAVARLVSDGLVQVEEQRGYRVAPVTLENLSEVTRLRGALEPLALRSSIENGDLDWEARVMATLYKLNHTDRRIDCPASLVAWEEAHNSFHEALIDRCEMPLLVGMLRSLLAMHDRYRQIFMIAGQAQRDLAAEHSAIAEAATRRDADTACALLASHIETTGAALRDRLGDHLPRSTE